MSKLPRRLFWLLLVCLVVFTCVLGWSWYSYVAWINDSFRQKYERVHMGMTEDEVISILGKPQQTESLGGGLSSYDVDTWYDGKRFISVAFRWDYVRPEVAYSKLFSPKLLWESLKDSIFDPNGEWPPPH